MPHSVRALLPTYASLILCFLTFIHQATVYRDKLSETVSVVVISSLSLKSYPGARPLPLSLRHCH